MTDLRLTNVTRGPRPMVINDRWRPAYEWCEMFGHDVPPRKRTCSRCGGKLRGRRVLGGELPALDVERGSTDR